MDGFVFPIRAVQEDEIGLLRRRFETELLPLWQDPTQETDYTFQTHMLFPWLDELVRRPAIVEAVSQILGRDLLLWNSGFIVKPARDAYFASWHQDLTYWGLEPPEVVTAWLAFTESVPENGCVRCIPGSHKAGVLPVEETRAQHNMLSRGQTIELGKAEATAVDMKLQAGEMSIHHGFTVHGSNGNMSDRPRIGMTMTFVTPAVRCRKGLDMVTFIAGEDRSGHFKLAPPPAADLHNAAIAVHAEAARLRKAVIHKAN
jgi:ectoine hydroxylase-related dioxygenase (phytanoyl-CoA dioxygenase family)